jgi:hypothetical protein
MLVMVLSPLCGLRQELAHTIQQFFKAESSGACAGREFRGQLRELPLAFRVVLGSFLGADECSGSLVSLERASEFEFPVRPQNCIRVDGEVNRKLPYRRELVAG